MSSCLGLYIEENLIKYAKVSKDHNQIRVETFGVKAYEDLNKVIGQIVEETYSYKIPISVNLSEETYNYFDMFALLNKKDLTKAIKTEFEAYCNEKGYNPNVFETRYAIVPNIEEREKLKVIYISQNKIELNKKVQQLDGYKTSAILPISMSLPTILETKQKENCLIVNIEDKTTITKILDQKIYDIQILEQGSKEILSKINLKENSYSKAYEICKNTTIYTSDGRELQDVETSYLEDIMPTLYDIVGKVMKIINESPEKIEKVYISGTLALINNIDLYFQEYLSDISCEILKPSFVRPSTEINMKDYIEVNTPISLALTALGEGISGVNFKNQSLSDKMPDWLKVEVKAKEDKPKDKKAISGWFTNDLKEKLDKTEIGLVRTLAGLAILFIIYSGFSSLLINQINKKIEEAKGSISNTNSQIALIDTDNNKIKTKTTEYTTKINNLQEINNRITDINKSRNIIPNLLNHIMHIIPEAVQITSIQNTTARHVEIHVQSNKYEQLGYFTAKLKNDAYLVNVISTAGEKENDAIKIKIEGDLP